jgi:LmbE family N-acetylglucosaminyl deacetylase
VVAEGAVVKALVVAPHMDDEVLGCTALIQRLPDTTVVFCTENEEDVRFIDGEYVGYRSEKREAEMEQVSELLGFEYVQLGLPLHSLDTYQTAKIVDLLEEWFRDVELVAYPAQSYDQDHEAIRKAVAVLSRPHRYAGTLLEYQTWGVPTHGDDTLILPLNVNAKTEAVALYASQIRPGGHYDELYPYAPASVMAHSAATGRLIHVDYAESYRPRRLVPNPTTAALLG